MSITREEELKNAQSRVDELESQLSQMHDSFEIAVAHLEKARDEAVKNVDMLQDEVADRDSEIANANKEIDSLGRNVYDLEEELERLKERHEQELGAALDRTQLNEEMADSLKEVRRIVTRSAIHAAVFLLMLTVLPSIPQKLSQMKAELTATRDAYDDLQTKSHEQANREEELRHRVKDALASRDSEHAARVKAERDMREFGDKLLEAEDEIKALRRGLTEVERSLGRDVEDKTRVSGIVQ